MIFFFALRDFLFLRSFHHRICRNSSLGCVLQRCSKIWNHAIANFSIFNIFNLHKGLYTESSINSKIYLRQTRFSLFQHFFSSDQWFTRDQKQSNDAAEVLKLIRSPCSFAVPNSLLDEVKVYVCLKTRQGHR